tara:strand:- start:596 stop:745 length:150 start_codon:yes stop_codon:yes gene_type:complete
MNAEQLLQIMICPICGGSNPSSAFWEFLAGIIALEIIYFLATFLIEIFF